MVLTCMQRRTVGIMRRVLHVNWGEFAPFARFAAALRIRAKTVRIMRRSLRGLTNLLKLV